MYEIHPIKMVEQSGKPDTSTTNGSIAHPEKNVNSEFSEDDEMHSDTYNYIISNKDGIMKLIRKRIFTVIFTVTALLSMLLATSVFASASADEAKAALAAELDRFEAADSSLYTTESFAAWQSAYNDGRIINNTLGASEDELLSALNALKAAYGALDKKGDTAPLALKLGEISSLDLSPYTPESAEALLLAYAEAEALLLRAEASEREINGAIKELELRRAMLKEIADFSELTSALEDAKAINLSEYSEDSARDVRAAIALAELIISINLA